jgi:hypothetical protein
VFDWPSHYRFLGEKLSDQELDIVVKDCLDPEDEDGMIPYVRKWSNFYYYHLDIIDVILISLLIIIYNVKHLL